MRSDLRIHTPDRPRFLSEADCRDIAQRLARSAIGGGETEVHIVSRWTGNVRWARNRITTTGEDRDNHLTVKRTINGASSYDSIRFNNVSDEALVAAARQAERVVHQDYERFESDAATRQGSPIRYQDEPADRPNLFFESTYQLDASQRAAAARELMQSAASVGMLSAGDIGVSATSMAYITSWGYTRYYQYTWAQYSVTVREPTGAGSGWAGVDWPDWSKIDGKRLSALALEKCLASRNPVTVEPGRYTTILEPQAVCDFVGPWGGGSDREGAETGRPSSFHKSGDREPPNIRREQLGFSQLGERVIDQRLTISADPMDPELGFPPYDKVQFSVDSGAIYHPVTYVANGVLKQLAYPRDYAIRLLGQNTGLPASGAFRISVTGQTTSVEEMIATTKRGLLVTRFDQVVGPDTAAMLCRGYTRDGLWLIEDGKISKPVKNMVFTESILFALNNVEQIGIPQRTFHPMPGGIFVWFVNPQPVIVPALKIKDFSFTALSGAI